jgi:hypothetical protein
MHKQMLSIEAAALMRKFQVTENKRKIIFQDVWSTYLEMYTPEIHSIDRLLGPCQSGFNS